MYFHHICFSFNYIHSFFQYFFFFSINWKLNFQSYFKSLLLKYNSSYSYRRRIFTWYFRQLKIEKDFPSGTIRLMIDKSCRDETTEERFVLDLIFPVHSFSISFNIDWIPQWLGRIRYLKKWYPMVARKKKDVATFWKAPDRQIFSHTACFVTGNISMNTRENRLPLIFHTFFPVQFLLSWYS